MDTYKSNSHKSKEAAVKANSEEKEIKKVVSGKAVTKNKSEIQKIADVFISEDVANVKSYVLMEVLVPAIKKAISDIVTNGIDMILYGEANHSTKKRNGAKVSYGSYYDRDRERSNSYARPSSKSSFDYDDIVFETRGDAELVITQMEEIISRYGFVSVSDLYDMADLTAPYTANKYGWTDVRTAEPMRARGGGYIIKLPKVVPYD